MYCKTIHTVQAQKDFSMGCEVDSFQFHNQRSICNGIYEGLIKTKKLFKFGFLMEFDIEPAKFV